MSAASSDAEWKVLSDSELARRGQRMTFIGVLLLLVGGLLTLMLVQNTKLEVNEAGPVRIKVPGAASDNEPAISVSGASDNAPRVAQPARRPTPPPAPAPRNPNRGSATVSDV